ncbi:MAG: hypothetical protein ABIS67_08815 [Candidatus Eisenbacteria bacterium]
MTATTPFAFAWPWVLTCLLATGAFAQSHSTGAAGTQAPRATLDAGLGGSHFEITTGVPAAQKFFDQGYRLLHAFNPEEAERAFREAVRLDPECAMAHWGVALSNGHNFNLPRLPWRDSLSYLSAQQASSLAAKASPRERALIVALTRRTSATFPARAEDATTLDRAYADAMRGVAHTYPRDPEVLALFAEALMDVYPWRLWSADMKPSPVTLELIATLERVLKLDPRHIGAHHLYIHAVEASAHPEKAVPSADFLVGKTPNAGHLVHMPSHIFERVGRYAEAVESNRQAVKVDEKYFALPTAGMLYTPYLAHNRHFIAFVSMIEGRYGEALPAGRATASTLPLEMHAMMPGMDFFCTTPYVVQIKFGRWDEILAEPAPPTGLVYTTAFWHFARGMAYAGKKRGAEAKVERDSMVFLRDALAEGAMQNFNPARTLLELARHTLEGAMARAGGDLAAAAEHYREAVAVEDGLQYSEPPDWMLFPRHDLGTALVEAGRGAEAEQVFRADLRKRSETGWALRGLELALRAQKKNREAAKVAARSVRALKNADAKITVAAY